MAKFSLYYKKFDHSYLGEFLKVKVDDEITFEVNKNEVYEIELSDGKHNVKAYCEGWYPEHIVGYVDVDIEIYDNVYYMYKHPLTIFSKGRLKKLKFNDTVQLKKHISITSFIYEFLFITIPITILIILFIAKDR